MKNKEVGFGDSIGCEEIGRDEHDDIVINEEYEGF